MRVVLLDEGGTVIATTSSSYESRHAPGGVVEQDPSSWSAALELALASMPELATNPPAAIGLCGQTPTVVPVDERGRPTRAALTWQDSRAGAEARELAERFGPPAPLVGTELPWSAANMPAKLLWLSRYEPELLRRTRTILQPKDFIGLSLTGSALSDPWSSKGLCNVDGVPLALLLESCGWSSEVCPATAAPWTPRGTVSAAAAQRYGLRQGTPVTVGASDAFTEMFSAGVFARSSAFVFSGTSSIVGTPVEDAGARVPGLFNVPTTCAPKPLLYGPTQSGGASLMWGARLLGCDVNELIALAATSDSTWPVFVPYLSGERAPLWDLDVRALFLAVDERHGRAEIAMSIVSGVFFAARHILALIEDATHQDLHEVQVVGRGVGDDSWESLARRSLGLPLRFHEDADMSARGSAILALTLNGTSVIDASTRLGAPSRLTTPDDEEVTAARGLLERYRQASEQALQWRNFEVSESLRG
jgi:xylulokinase